MKIVSIEVISKGMSPEKKYKVIDETGASYLCRLFPVDQAESARADYDYMVKFLPLELPMCKPIQYGTYQEHPYILQSWIDGVDIQNTIHLFSKDKQYQIGMQAGELLKKIHSATISEPYESWEKVFSRKTDRKISAYEKSRVQIERGRFFLKYLAENRHVVKNRPRVLLHGDFHLGNLILDAEGIVHAIDFSRGIPCDPWEDFDRIPISARASGAFASGMIDGYFFEDVPCTFWKLLALYTSSKMISFLTWSQHRDQSCIDLITGLSNDVLDWYDDMKTDIPSWYHPEQGK